MSADLPAKPNLRHLKKQAKDLHKSFQAGDTEICALLQQHLPRFAQSSPDEILTAEFSLHDAQHIVAREYGFDHWSALERMHGIRRDDPATWPAEERPSPSTTSTVGSPNSAANSTWCPTTKSAPPNSGTRPASPTTTSCANRRRSCAGGWSGSN